LDVPFISSLELLLLLVNFTKIDQIKFYILSPPPCHSAAAAGCWRLFRHAGTRTNATLTKEVFNDTQGPASAAGPNR
jgi:hypothetical protein